MPLVATYKKVLVDVGLADSGTVDFDTRRGSMWNGRVKIAEWVGDGESGKLMLQNNRLKDAGMDVEARMIDAAVDEALARK